jgi:hypothetical protein
MCSHFLLYNCKSFQSVPCKFSLSLLHCSYIARYEHFREMCCIHVQDPEGVGSNSTKCCLHNHPFVPLLPWRALCCRWNFLQGVGGVHRIGQSPHYFPIYLYLRYKVYSYPVKETKSYSTKRKGKSNRNFPPEIITFVFQWPRYTPPHSYCSLDCQHQSSNSFVCH